MPRTCIPPCPLWHMPLLAGHPVLCSYAELRCALLDESDWVCKRLQRAAKKWTLCATCCSTLAAAYSSGVHKTLWQCHFDCIQDAELSTVILLFSTDRTARVCFTVVSYQARIRVRIGSTLAAAYSGVHRTLWQCYFVNPVSLNSRRWVEHCCPFVFHQTAKECFTVASYLVVRGGENTCTDQTTICALYSFWKCWHCLRLLLTCTMRVLCGKYLLICCHLYQSSEMCKSLLYGHWSACCPFLPGQNGRYKQREGIRNVHSIS